MRIFVQDVLTTFYHFFLFYLQRTITALQNHILGFTQRLHAAEVDRRSLRLELSKNKQETSELKSAQSSAESQHRKAKDEARGLEERLQGMKEEVRQNICLNRRSTSKGN